MLESSTALSTSKEHENFFDPRPRGLATSVANQSHIARSNDVAVDDDFAAYSAGAERIFIKRNPRPSHDSNSTARRLTHGIAVFIGSSPKE